MKRYNTDNQLSEIFKKYDAFYAFSNKQFDEQKKAGVKYAGCGSGLICPVEHVDTLYDAISKAINGKIEWELANNTKKEIIWYELANHECQISGEYIDVIELLSDYGITADEIHAEWKAYYSHCIDNDLF